MGNLVDATTGTVHSTVFVALPRVAPIDDKHVTIGPKVEVHASKKRILGDQKIRFMPSGKASPESLQSFNVSSQSMHVQRKQPPLVFVWPMLCRTDRCSDVSMPAAEFVRLSIATVGPISLGIKMIMISDHVQPFVDTGIHALAKRFLQMRTWHHVP